MNYNTLNRIAFLLNKRITLLCGKTPHFYTAEVSYFYTAKVSFFAVLQPCFLHNKKPGVWEMNFTAIKRKITQQKCDVLVLFLRTFTQQKHTFGYKGPEYDKNDLTQISMACRDRESF
jgi:hypothetical protein